MAFNGTTWYDRTNYFETFPASDESLDWALGMEADRMVNSTVLRKDLDSEMTVVRNEMERNENSAVRILIQRTAAAGFDWHNYGKDTIGARTDVERVDIGRLQAFYRLYYQPDNAVLIIAGAFDPDRALALVAKYFGPLPKPSRVLPALYTDEPVQDGEREVTLRRVGNTQWLSAMYHTVPRRASGRHRDLGRGRRDDRRVPAGACTRRWSKPRKPPPSTTSSTPATIPALRCFSRRCRKTSRWTRRARRCCR